MSEGEIWRALRPGKHAKERETRDTPGRIANTDSNQDDSSTLSPLSTHSSEERSEIDNCMGRFPNPGEGRKGWPTSKRGCIVPDARQSKSIETWYYGSLLSNLVHRLLTLIDAPGSTTNYQVPAGASCQTVTALAFPHTYHSIEGRVPTKGKSLPRAPRAGQRGNSSSTPNGVLRGAKNEPLFGFLTREVNGNQVRKALVRLAARWFSVLRGYSALTMLCTLQRNTIELRLRKLLTVRNTRKLEAHGRNFLFVLIGPAQPYDMGKLVAAAVSAAERVTGGVDARSKALRSSFVDGMALSPPPNLAVAVCLLTVVPTLARRQQKEGGGEVKAFLQCLPLRGQGVEQHHSWLSADRGSPREVFVRLMHEAAPMEDFPPPATVSYSANEPQSCCIKLMLRKDWLLARECRHFKKKRLWYGSRELDIETREAGGRRNVGCVPKPLNTTGEDVVEI
ncbi:hypothetical protein BU15DRAFT_60301 [Melanogaster broomeanus]|nr:hypothetical protein BU15DRAFT_60301 [Melanogaster broomeanus]